MKGHNIKKIKTDMPFEGEVLYMEPMMKHTSLKIGGPADIFAIPRDMPSLGNICNTLKNSRIPVFPLGGGTNVIVRDGGIAGAVICMKSFRRIGVAYRDDTFVYLLVESGTMLGRFVHYAEENGYSGIEGLAGIPGTVGGAIWGNAGAFGFEIKDVLVSVNVADLNGKQNVLRAKDIDFGYRTSGIPAGQLIISAEIRLKIDKQEEVSARVGHYLKEKKEKQPLWEASAGCVFKNPPGNPAGKLIEEAGCKGMRIGDVEVSSLHANFFINRGKASASDFIMLMEEVADKVKKKFGLLLEPEISIVGRDRVD
jgi:UDP-N-acetylmuramate dehydrogenase